LLDKSEKYAISSSDAEKNATKAERDAEDVKKAEFMEDKIGFEYEGIVSSVTGFGMFVELESTVEGIVRFENMGDEYFRYDETNKNVSGTFAAGTEIGLSNMNITLDWPKTSSVTNSDEIGTYMAAKGSSVKIIYTILYKLHSLY
jgi:ribonuclease R